MEAVTPPTDAQVAEYRRLLSRHDWSYSMSDDYSAYRAGGAERADLEARRALIDRDYSIWNEVAPRGHRKVTK